VPAWALLAWSGGLIMLLARLRYGGEAAALAWPVGGTWVAWPMAPIACFVAALVLLWRGRSALRRRDACPAFVQLWLLATAVFGWQWAFLPPFNYRGIDLAFFSVLLAALAGMLLTDRRGARRMGLRGRHFLANIKWLAGPTLGVLAGCYLLGRWYSAPIETDEVWISLLTYPLYAFVQMLFMIVAVTGRLERTQASRATIVFVTAGLFALIHWPNGPLMAGCFLMGLLWTGLFVRIPNLYAIALSMGLAATAWTQFLPVTWTQNARVGPIYVERGLQWQRHGPPVAHD
jgi:hypothetical protein